MDEARTQTLAIDVGGSRLKMIVLDAHGQPVSERTRVDTPRPATPSAVIDALIELAQTQPAVDRVSCGFPGVVVDNVVHTAPNLDGDWSGIALGEQLSQALGVPARVANDADVQGLGVIEGRGVELVLTLGTGLGAALFVDGHLVPNLELGHHPFADGKSYEQWLGKAGRSELGREVWSQTFLKAIATLEHLFNYRALYVGGGDAKKLTVQLPDNARITDNQAGLLGGIALWR